MDNDPTGLENCYTREKHVDNNESQHAFVGSSGDSEKSN